MNPLRFTRIFDPCVLADEIRHAGDALLDCFVGSGVAEADVLAFVRYARTEMDISQHCDAGFVRAACGTPPNPWLQSSRRPPVTFGQA